MVMPKRKMDWVGRKISTRGVLRNGNMEIPAGTVLKVIRNRSGLHLVGEACPSCKVRIFIRGVSEHEVELLPEEEPQPVDSE